MSETPTKQTNRSEYLKQYRLKNKEKIAQYNKKYFQENKEIILEKRNNNPAFKEYQFQYKRCINFEKYKDHLRKNNNSEEKIDQMINRYRKSLDEDLDAIKQRKKNSQKS